MTGAGDPFANVGAVFIVATNGNDILTGDTTEDTLAPDPSALRRLASSRVARDREATAALGWRPCDRLGHDRERHQN